MAKHHLDQFSCICGVDPETLIPEATDENVAVVGSDDEALGVHLDALVQEVCYLPPVCPCAAGYERIDFHWQLVWLVLYSTLVSRKVVPLVHGKEPVSSDSDDSRHCQAWLGVGRNVGDWRIRREL